MFIEHNDYNETVNSSSLTVLLTYCTVLERVSCFMISDCGIPTSVNHSTVLYSHGTLVGANATYTCSNGYKVSGQQTIICQSTGKWANEPYCFIGW